MGEVVEFRPDPGALDHAERVRFACWLVDRSHMVPEFLRRGFTLTAVYDELWRLTKGSSRPSANARHLASLIGRAGTRRRDRPKSPNLYRKL